MIEINHYSNQKENNHDEHETDKDYDNHRDHDRHCERDRCHDREPARGEHCRKKTKPPVVLAPVVAVAGGTTLVGAFPGTTVIQILNNAAVLATYTLVLQPLQRGDTGFLVVETAIGITLLIVTGAKNVSSSALTTAGSHITLEWTGDTWAQI